jgi:hypothetical protein
MFPSSFQQDCDCSSGNLSADHAALGGVGSGQVAAGFGLYFLPKIMIYIVILSLLDISYLKKHHVTIIDQGSDLLQSDGPTRTLEAGARRDRLVHFGPNGAIGIKVPIMLTKSRGVTSPSPGAKLENSAFGRPNVGEWINLIPKSRSCRNKAGGIVYTPEEGGKWILVIVARWPRRTVRAPDGGSDNM